MEIKISSEIQQACPELKLAVLECVVKNKPTPEALWEEMETEADRIKETFPIDKINQIPAIRATREAYKILGKDPSRYRPSAEALCRRIVRGLPLYHVSLLVDLINLVSIRSGFSIGGFDYDKIQGNLTLGVGTASEEFEAIGRGMLNIEGLPVYRDDVGGIGTPTSDNERTKITDDTRHLLMIINGYSGENGLQEAVNQTLTLLGKYTEITYHDFRII